jgi:methyl-accepting chemotaxis protein
MQIRTIKTKLLLYFIPITVIVLVCSAFLIAQSSRTTILNLVEKETNEKVTVMEMMVEEWLQGIKNQVYYLANSSMAKTMKPENYLSVFSEVVKNSNGVFDYILVSDPTGNYINRDGVTANIKDRDYYKDIFINRKDVSISNALISKGSGKAVIVIAFPIRNDKNNLVGMAAATVNIESMSNRISSIQYAEGEFTFVTDGAGIAIAHSSDPNQIMSLNVLQSDEKGFKGLEEAGAKMTRGEQGTANYSRPDGTAFQLFYKPIPGTPNWSLGVGVPEKNITAKSTQMVLLLFITFGIIIAVVAIAAYIVGVVVSNPIKEVGKELKRFGELDFTRTVSKADDYLSRKDEIGQMTIALSKMVGEVRSTLSSVNAVVDNMSASSTELAGIARQQTKASDELAVQAQKVENNVQNVSASIEQVTSGVEEVAASAQGVSKTAQELAEEMLETSSAVDNGMRAVTQAIDSIEKAQNQTRETSRVAAEVADQAKKVGEIVESISSISEQTNLLALNAAIEAARAGEAGRGFAVVADEIRKLAEESKAATSNITGILKQLTEGVRKADTASNKTVEIVQEVNENGTEIGEQFKKITTNVEKINLMISNLTATSQEQGASAQEMASAMDTSAKAVSEIREQIEKMALGVAGQAKGAGAVNTSAGQLDELATKVSAEMSKFRLSD